MAAMAAPSQSHGRSRNPALLRVGGARARARACSAQPQRRRMLILGTGFVGRHVSQQLLRDGWWVPTSTCYHFGFLVDDNLRSRAGRCPARAPPPPTGIASAPWASTPPASPTPAASDPCATPLISSSQSHPTPPLSVPSFFLSSDLFLFPCFHLLIITYFAPFQLLPHSLPCPNLQWLAYLSSTGTYLPSFFPFPLLHYIPTIFMAWHVHIWQVFMAIVPVPGSMRS